MWCNDVRPASKTPNPERKIKALSGSCRSAVATVESAFNISKSDTSEVIDTQVKYIPDMKLPLAILAFTNALLRVNGEITQEPIQLQPLQPEEVVSFSEALRIYGLEEPLESRLVLYEDPNDAHFLQIEIVDELDKFLMVQKGIKFQDITRHWQDYIDVNPGEVSTTQDQVQIWDQAVKNSKFQVNSKISFENYRYPNKSEFHTQQVVPLFKDIDTSQILSRLSNFTSFNNRYYKSDSGLQSQVWLYNEILELIPQELLDSRVEVTLFDHKEWKQQSIIVTFYGEKAVKKGSKYVDKGPVVVLGAHQDSANALFPQILSLPGADDDGSGSMTILEALRVVLLHKLTFVNTVEFHFYSAEELGLLGSLDVFNDYKLKGVQVIAMLQQDMTGYVSAKKSVPEHLGVTTDYTSGVLYNFVLDIIDLYCLIPAKLTKCGYACSDHSSAMQNGYPAIMVIESLFEYTNPFIHSRNDRVDKLSLTHIAENVKMDLGYLYELGQLQEIESSGVFEVDLSSWGTTVKRLFYKHFDLICWFMLIYITLLTVISVKLVQELGPYKRLRSYMLRRKYRFLRSMADPREQV